ncbi:TetR/AcrR family transcriptional regulator [Candidatus Halocynthiibacter alkanivorans]|uniref:TetR/AcrR family transcriptional regulator n=1 Tax=Candidatus Halocynthiibacter alkanivorans TaxID=2267619 RepID=UPI00190FAB33|nr:TetR/AcrR family transcriptional regulator [Candidatus Halocynthiibacter alkanivorans]
MVQTRPQPGPRSTARTGPQKSPLASPPSETASRIMDIGERMARGGGYNSFSFREIAAEIGIKPASVHYHFATKELLGAAIASRYTERFLQALGAPDALAPDIAIGRYIEAYRGALIQEELMCLCGMFGAQIACLPETVAHEAQAFFERNMAWLETVFARSGFTPEAARPEAASLIATLEGAMILARTMQDPALFDAILARRN